MTIGLTPVQGSWVAHRETGRRGVVQGAAPQSSGVVLSVVWVPEMEPGLIPLTEVRCGLSPGMEVVDANPLRRGLPSGLGEVVSVRQIGDREQALVDFVESGYRAWVPFENCRQVRGVRHRFYTGFRGREDDPERLRLRTLAYAIESWNENTGALSHLDVDPLPHQIHLVHHILASGNLNWLIADDVGLGKTIETGMLLAALRQRGLARRVLLITPAGLTRQWKEELYFKFRMDNFEVFGEDFWISETRQWKMHDAVIASMDRLKQQHHRASLLQAEPWDLIIVDEAHRLSRRQYGQKYDASERFELVRDLRPHTRSLLFLTGTPHQGLQDKFIALLELLRPERRSDFQLLSLKPEIIGDMVFRNHKADVTDLDGAFVFKGKSSNTISIPLGSEYLAFDRALQEYFRKGYAAGLRFGSTGRAIGFVMTTFRKLAASSVPAIHSALSRRLDKVRQRLAEIERDAEDDSRFEGEAEELYSGEAREFFSGEVALLESLIRQADHVLLNDEKLFGFLDFLIKGVLAKDPSRKILIFTEYRKTQAYLASHLSTRYGVGSVVLIHGSMPHEERSISIQSFEQEAQFLISTEAGGEGINLHRRCHTLVNYDLPWNPMRLVQRVGRLYRYGQTEPVVVFNLHATGSIDEDIIRLLYDRIDAVVSDMAAVQKHEFNDGLRDDILGDVSELLDVEAILEESTVEGIQRTDERIQEALSRARDAAQKQRDLFDHAARYEADDRSGALEIGREHVLSFARGMLGLSGASILSELHDGKVLRVRLDDETRQALSLRSTIVDISADRLLVQSRKDTHMLDLSSPLLNRLIRQAKDLGFGGLTASLIDIGGEAMCVGMLRWQDAQGARVRQALYVFLTQGTDFIVNGREVSDWLMSPARLGGAIPSAGVGRSALERADGFARGLLSNESNEYLHPECLQWISCAWLQPTAQESSRSDG